jgi:hypothetical protein
VQGIGRIGRTTQFGSKQAGVVILYNDEDLKTNAPGMTDEMRGFLRSSRCLKDQLASYFGYSCLHEAKWCCSAE